MDNVSAIAESKQELTKMLQVIDNFLSKWQLKVNQSKSGIIVFNEKYNVNKKEENLKINIGNKVLGSKNSYKYLNNYSKFKSCNPPPSKRNTNKWNNTVVCF